MSIGNIESVSQNAQPRYIRFECENLLNKQAAARALSSAESRSIQVRDCKNSRDDIKTLPNMCSGYFRIIEMKPLMNKGKERI